MTLETSPLPFHRARRDHQMRVLFSIAQKLLAGRVAKSLRDECAATLHEAIHHGREVLRERELEWPGVVCTPADRELLAWLQEFEAWLNLLDHLSEGGDDVRPAVRELIGIRIKHGLMLFHTKTRPGHPVMS